MSNLYYPLAVALYILVALWQGNLGHW